MSKKANEERLNDIRNLKLYTLVEITQILGVTHRTLFNYVKAGKLKAVKIGGQWRVSEENLREFIDGGEKA